MFLYFYQAIFFIFYCSPIFESYSATLMGCEQSQIVPFANQVSRQQIMQEQSIPIQPIQPQQFQEEQHGGQVVNRPQQARTAFPPQKPPQVQAQSSRKENPPPSPQPRKVEPVKPNKEEVQENKGLIKHHIAPRSHLDPHVNYQDDFLAHHLRYELTLTKLTSMKRIRRRQLIEHLWLQCFWNNFGGIPELNINYQGYQESILSTWLQRTFLDIWEIAHDDLFVKGLEAKIVRRKVAEQYMFQLFQIKQFVDSGMASINFLVDDTRTELFSFTQASDDALFNLFKQLKLKYPQTSGGGQDIDFPDIPTTKTKQNILDNFPTLCFSDPDHMNYQTIYSDINFLLKKAIELQHDFKEDMKEILGDDVLACPKVGQVMKDGRTSFNACAVRRVFVKWCENLLEKCPELQYTKTFMLFIKARSNIVKNFFFKSTIQPTTHKIVLDCISLLLELAKFGLKNKQKRHEFIFNIYDLLRCKIKRGTPQQIVNLLEKMKSTKVTKSGQKFEVLRVKNRFKTNNRDLLINFRYGDVLVGEAQLCLDSAGVSKEAKLNYEFCHYIYELERSLFGPTIELMMSYEDFQRPDITVDFQAQDLVPVRRNEHIELAGPVDRKCLHGHDMISLVGNFFFPARTAEQTQDQTIETQYPSVCNFCDRQSTTSVNYDYCYHCCCYLCKKCTGEYKKANKKQCWLSIQRQELLPEIKNMNELKNICGQKKSIVVIFWLNDSSASGLFRDGMIYHQGKLIMQPKKFIPNIGAVKFSPEDKQIQQMCKKYQVNQFPTVILFDQKAKPVRTVIGFSWFEIATLYATQERIISGKGIKHLNINCLACNEQMQAEMGQAEQQQQEEPEDEDDYDRQSAEENEGERNFNLLTADELTSKCLNCFGTAVPINLPEKLKKIQIKCSSGHIRCLNCCYAALEIPSTYKDFMGGSYLVSNFTKPKLPKCSKGHQTVLSRKDPVNTWEFHCIKCKKQRFFDNQNGIGQCDKCKEYICAFCLGADRPSFKDLIGQRRPDLVRHFVESTAEQACLCICQRHFKKAYCGRILSLEEIDQEHSKKWKCFLCQGEGKDGELHMACFACPTLSEAMGQKFNFEICLRCATKSKMLMRQPPSKVLELPSLFSCPKDGKPMVHTTYSYKNEIVIKCHYCKKRYFGNTERFVCVDCDLHCCKNCREHLWKGKPPKCPQKCPEGHELLFEFVKPKSLQYCDGCMTVMRDEAFKCSEDDYVLCSDCVKNNPPNFIGKVMSHLRAENQKEPFEGGFELEEGEDEFNYNANQEYYEQEEDQFDWDDDDF